MAKLSIYKYVRTDNGWRYCKAALKKWSVDTKSLRLKPTAKTPVIIEKVKKDSSGVPFHTFSFSCPACGGRLPQFQPVISEAVTSLTKRMARADVLFIDRVSRSAVTLA